VPFSPGEAVHVAALGKGIVREVRNGRRYLVELKGRSVVVAEDQLTATQQTRPPGTRAPAKSELHTPTRDHVPTSLDLHGMTVEEAIAALDAFLSDALLAGHAEVRVIHGRSGGRLKAATHARLKSLSAARGFRVDPANPGVTIVAL
jgi:DNA mismatch repair protein MutS2